jgi:catechol 2,3-dioxygenase-like lactoylglutathione lyase family enzyme
VIDYQRVFHSGVRVPDLDKAMADLGPALGVAWAQPREGEQPIWTPSTGPQTAMLRFTYSIEGPQHVELVEGAAGSVWDAGSSPGLHHVGVWVDDIVAETTRLLDAGWELVAAQRSPAEGFGVFSYLAPASGLIVELVDAAVEPHFAAWWSAGAVAPG